MSAHQNDIENKSLRPDGLEDKATAPAAKPEPAPAAPKPLADGIDIVVSHYMSDRPELAPGEKVRLPAADANRLIVAGLARLAGA